LIVDGQPVYNYSRTAGVFTWDAQQTGLPWESGQFFSSTTGINYASFLLGLTNSVQVAAPSVSRMGNHTTGLYIQDTWKATRKLTVDYGLRYDLSTLLREQYGRMQNANFTKINPTVVPLGASQGLPGLVEYEANCNCRFGQTYKYAFGPRLWFQLKTITRSRRKDYWLIAGLEPRQGWMSKPRVIS
jgi:outer membrane receptor protein involved in Fe transport